MSQSASASAPSRAAGKRERATRARREQLLAAAASVFRAKGLNTATMNDVAEEVGAAKIVLYRYFGSKDELINAVLADAADRLLELDADRDADWPERHRRILAFARERPDAIFLLLRHAPEDALYSANWERYRDAIGMRTRERLEAAFPGRKPRAVSLEFCAQTLTHFVLDAVARWISAPARNARADEDFVSWLNVNVDHMCRLWLAPRSSDPASPDKP